MRIVRRLLLALLVLVTSSASLFGQLRISVSFGPPVLPIYEQPLCPGDGYIWVPGYWAWDDDYDDYYWVPGTWVLPPEADLLWTPPYWAWSDGAFVFYDGYWGPMVGFYGGIDYGFGYPGEGFVGGRWDHGHFFYNRAVMNVNVNVVHNVYNTTVINTSTRTNRVSYNGGNGGVNARPTPQEEAAAREHHVSPVAAQLQQRQAARSNPQFRASTNRGKPPVAATARPAEFSGRGAVPARAAGAPYNPPANRSANRPRQPERGGSSKAIHPNELPPIERPAAPNTGNAKLDQKYQKEQQKMVQQQEKERQKLQQQQAKEDQRVARQKNEAMKQQTEQRHQQQTQQMQQRHTQQSERMQQRQAPAPRPEPKRPR